MSDARDPSWPVEERGEGTPVVFLPGYPLTHRIWHPQLELLSPRCHVVLLDLPGYGIAEGWSVPDTMAGFARSVHQTLARRFSVPVVLVGHSFGGYVALELMREHPEQFCGLLLTDTRSEADSPEAKEKRWATITRLRDPAQHLDVEEAVRPLFAPATWTAGGPLIESVRSMVRSVPSGTIVGSLKAIAGRSDLTPVLASIRVPTLVVWGEEDKLIPPEQSRSMVPRIRGGVGTGIPGTGHLPFLEAPPLFARAVGDLLDRIRSP